MAPRSKKPAAPHPDVMTIAELAAYLRCNKSTIYRLIKKDKLPAFRIGSDWRFKRELIEKWMEEQRSKFSLPEAQVARSPRGHPRLNRRRQDLPRDELQRWWQNDAETD